MFETLAMIENSIVAYGDAMKILAADVQNFQADGFKQTRYSFVSVFSEQIARMGGSTAVTPGSPNTTSIAQGVTLIPLGFDFSQGGIRQAGNMNAALNGNGMFVLKPENASHLVYTRASDFVINSDGSVVDVYGRDVMGYAMTNGVADTSTMVPITVDPTTVDTADIGFEDGGILTSNFSARKSAIENGEEIPAGEQLFQLTIAKIPNPSRMEAFVGNSYRATIASGEASGFGISNDDGYGEVIGASAESSNVNPAETTIVGIQLQRGYNAVQASLTLINRTLSVFMSTVEKALS